MGILHQSFFTPVVAQLDRTTPTLALGKKFQRSSGKLGLLLPDENDLDFGRSFVDDGGGSLVTTTVHVLTIDLGGRKIHS